MLFLELALIRWLGSNIIHLSYFSNFVLLGSFLGVGLGFLVARKPWTFLPYAPVLLGLLIAVVAAFPVTINQSGNSLVYFTSLNVSGPPAYVVLPTVFVLVALVLIGPAEVVGRAFAHLEPLTAYRWDLVGSLIGIAGFSALSFLGAPPIVWGVVVLAGFIVLGVGKKAVLGVLALSIALTLLVKEGLVPGNEWSPYYKLNIQRIGTTPDGEPALLIRANGVPHQLMASADFKLNYAEAQYGTPYLRRNPAVPLNNVLIVGAGSGSDVAIALQMGAKHVDAVDIDPDIIDVGIAMNPDHAYQDPRVTLHVNDGRAFLEDTTQKYDLILFALPDSLSLVTGASQIRLESFLFTKESIESVRSHLTPDGSFSMYNYYRDSWLIQRLAGTVSDVFGHAPCVDQYTALQAVVSVGLNAQNQRCGADNLSVDPNRVAPATDDRPFLYFRGGMVPAVYLWIIALILLFSLLSVRVVGGPLRNMRRYLDLFFMGVAFLLLETKNVATFALLFGTTWFVNALVFMGVLVIVLAAVETTRRLRTPSLPTVFALIAASLVAAYVIRPEWLLPLTFFPRLVAAVVLAFLPIYLANIAFAKRFATTADPTAAFGVNLLGAILGGCIEYFALLTGYNNLLIVAGVIYLAAFVTKPKESVALG